MEIKIAKIFFVGVESKLLNEFKKLPLVVVDSLEQADILFVGKDFDEELVDYLSLGVVPVLPEKYGFIDYNSVMEVGDAFNYVEESEITAVYALSRAIENHKFIYDWKSIQSNFNTRLKLTKKSLV